MTHALILLCINQHTKFEVLSFNNSKDIIGAKFKKRVTWPKPRPLGSSPSSKAKHLIYSTCTQNLATLASAVPKKWWRATKL